MGIYRYSFRSSVQLLHKQQTTIRKPIECAPEASMGGNHRPERIKAQRTLCNPVCNPFYP